MPVKPAGMCRNPHCPNLTRDPSGYCPLHIPAPSLRLPDHRAAPSSRGYDREWRKVREEVLARYDIPRRLWPRYDVDHNPPYNPAIEPDHRKYTLIPRLHGTHSSKTAREDGGFGHAKGGGVESLGDSGVYRTGWPNFHTTDSGGKGVGHA